MLHSGYIHGAGDGMAKDERSGGILAGITARKALIVAALFIVGYFGLSIASNAITHERLEGREAALREEIAALERRDARLQSLKRYMETDSFVESVARENGYVRPGETQVVLVGAPASTASLQPGDPWWFRYLHPEDRR